MKFASYRVRGRDSFSAVVGESVVDLLRGAAPTTSISTFMTLTSGDVLEIEAPGIGTLRNTVMAEA